MRKTRDSRDGNGLCSEDGMGMAEHGIAEMGMGFAASGTAARGVLHASSASQASFLSFSPPSSCPHPAVQPVAVDRRSPLQLRLVRIPLLYLRGCVVRLLLSLPPPLESINCPLCLYFFWGVFGLNSFAAPRST
jgi:hypothetical protein